MQLSAQLQSKLEHFAQSKNMTNEQAVEFILTTWLREHPVVDPSDSGMTPDELNASNNG